MKKKRLVNIFFYLGLMVLLVITVSLAWFNNGKTGEADDIVFATIDAPYTEIAIDDDDYDPRQATAGLDGFLARPVSGRGTVGTDGEIQLWAPIVENKETGAFATDNSGNILADRATEDGKDYFQFDVKIRSLSACEVGLGEDSAVTPLDLTARVNKLVDDLPLDYIAGAIRVSFSEVTTVDNEETETLKLVWIPNPDYELTVDQNGKKVVNTGSETTQETDLTYFDGTSFVSCDTLFTSDLSNVTLSTTLEDTDGYFYAKYRVRVWVEGTDREAVTELSGGQFKIQLAFIAKGVVQDG